MNVDVLTGPPGCGKSFDLREEAITVPGLYLFSYPSLDLLEEQVRAFDADPRSPTVLEAHSESEGGGNVQSKLDRHRQYLADQGVSHAVVLITHEGMMGSDLSAFGDWHVRIDEAPVTIQSGEVKAAASADLLKQVIAIDPVGRHGWGQLRLLNGAPGWRALQNDDLFNKLAEMLKQAGRQHGVFVDTLEWKDSFGWCSIWPLRSLDHCQSVKIAGASYPISLGALVAERWEGVKFNPVVKQVSRQKQPAVRIHYFTQSHEGDTSFWDTSRGRGFIVKVCDFLSAKEPDLGYWSANDDVKKLLDHRLVGRPISAKAAGLNQYDEETSCALIYSSKSMSGDAPAKALFSITNEQIFRAREHEDIVQFVLRGAIRRRDFDGDYDIYLYSRRQAELVAAELKASQIGRSVDVIPEPGAGIMDEVKDRMKPIRDAIKAEKAAESARDQKENDASRHRDARANRAVAEGRKVGKSGRPKGSADKKPRKRRGPPI